MNIQRFKWPVIVAAGLHGALFLCTPDSSLSRIKTQPVKAIPLPPLPDDPIIQIDQLDPETSPDATPANGGPAVPELPDLIMPIPDKLAFTTPQVDHPPAEKYENTLKNHLGGPDGPNLGPIPSARTTWIDGTKLDRKPRATAQIPPDYPSAMRQQGIAGSVTVEFDVDLNGRVVRAEVVSSTRREFAEPALRAVRNWRFEPGTRHGRTVAFRMTVPIEFGLGVD